CQALATAIDGALAQRRGALAGPAAASGPRWAAAGFASACLGLSGVDSAEDEALVSRWLREQALAPRTMVVNDSELVLAGRPPAGRGVGLRRGAGARCRGRPRGGPS